MTYIINNPDVILNLLWEHVYLTVGSLVIAIVIALPLGYLIHGRERLSTTVLGVLGIALRHPQSGADDSAAAPLGPQCAYGHGRTDHLLPDYPGSQCHRRAVGHRSEHHRGGDAGWG